MKYFEYFSLISVIRFIQSQEQHGNNEKHVAKTAKTPIPSAPSMYLKDVCCYSDAETDAISINHVVVELIFVRLSRYRYSIFFKISNSRYFDMDSPDPKPYKSSKSRS
ncbi:hypothetical protein L596_017007 [Steinernema carpocapsae]|uniref:Uncharacterized protein n=1 Tax=Steinernema carpocapsae TaxID=34508 RepID=A0A4U5N0M7_STECR|nr:hypothetical protein L596_017007 [Steinernema carpocapsae]